jgi:hypothetical protein
VSDEPQDSVDRLQQRKIARSLACSRCGYDLRGLPIGGQCPECGLEIWETVQAVVDPAARQLPRLRNPPGVGNALVWLVICVVGVTLLTLGPPLTERLMLRASVSLVRWTPPVATLAAGILALLGLWSAWKLAPPIGAEPRGAVWRDIWLLTIGLVATSASCITSWVLYRTAGKIELLVMGFDAVEPLWTIPLFTLLASAIVTMLALGGILRVIGERSREYRTARGGRQRTREMIAAFVGLAIGVALRPFGPVLDLPHLPVLGDIVFFVSAFMLLVGLAYLLANAIWIRRSLCALPPTIEQLMRAPSDEPPGSDDG